MIVYNPNSNTTVWFGDDNGIYNHLDCHDAAFHTQACRNVGFAHAVRSFRN